MLLSRKSLPFVVTFFVAILRSCDCNVQRTLDIVIAPHLPPGKLRVTSANQPNTMDRFSTFDLSCHVQPGDKAVTLSWYKNGAIFSDSSRARVIGWLGIVYEDYQIRFYNFSSEDAGIYLCVSSEGQRVSTVLQVVPEFVGESSDYVTTEVGANVTLPCQVDAWPPARLSWIYKGRTVASLNSSSNQRLAFEKRVNRQDNGTYKCEARNTAGGVRKLTDLLVIEKLKWTEQSESTVVVQYGQTVSLLCRAHGHPSPYVTWTHLLNGADTERPLPDFDGKEQIIFQVKSISGLGRYSCEIRSPLPCCQGMDAQPPLTASFEVTSSRADQWPSKDDTSTAVLQASNSFFISITLLIITCIFI